ncbi:MAG: hypothetical protein HY814_05610, partial [Candidatus Riflebacteria bacterium]|nr:hypothetical protein [Candidatus Riflebacteria bacterium]
LLGAGGGDGGGFGGGMLSYPQIPEFDSRSLLNFERETLGLYLSGHPLLAHQRLLESTSGLLSTADVPRMSDAASFAVAGMVRSLRKIRSKAGKDMAIILLEDTRGSLELPFFGERYEEAKGCLKEDAVVVVWGSVQDRNGERRASADGAMPLESLFGERGWKASITLTLPAGGLTKDQAAKVKNILLNHKGKHAVEVCVPVAENRVFIRLGKDFKIQPNAELIVELEELLGEGSMAIGLTLPERPAPRFQRGGPPAARGAS